MLITKLLDPRRLNSTVIGAILYGQSHNKTDGKFWGDLSEGERLIYIDQAQSMLDVMVGMGIFGTE